MIATKFYNVYVSNAPEADKILTAAKNFKGEGFANFENTGSYVAVFNSLGNEVDEHGYSLRTSHHAWITPDKKLVVDKELEKLLLKESSGASA